MPSNTIPSALVSLYYSGDNLEGAPWIFPVWQEITGVLHGLFPEDDAELPTGWTRGDANDVEDYFEQYTNQKSSDDKVRFAAMRKPSARETVPGRAIWRTWITRNSRPWKIQQRITEVLQQHGLTPLQLSIANKGEVPCESTLFLAKVLEKVGLALFGEEALNDSDGLLQWSLMGGTLTLAQRTWENLKKQLGRSKLRLEKLERVATDAIERTLHSPVNVAPHPHFCQN